MNGKHRERESEVRRIPKCEITEPGLENVGNLIFKKYLRDDFRLELKNSFWSLHFLKSSLVLRDFNMNI